VNVSHYHEIKLQYIPKEVYIISNNIIGCYYHVVVTSFLLQPASQIRIYSRNCVRQLYMYIQNTFFSDIIYQLYYNFSKVKLLESQI